MRIEDQPAPIPNDRPSIHDLVLQDMLERKAIGLERYGTPLQAGNGRDALIDLYQELQDAVAYTRQKIEEDKILWAKILNIRAQIADLEYLDRAGIVLIVGSLDQILGRKFV